MIIQKLSNANANLSLNRSNTITKQTVLSSITANEVTNNTHLKGSLIAAGEYKTIIDENGNKQTIFIDNQNLNLTTNALAYENLSNTSYKKETALSLAANYALANSNSSNNKENNTNNQTNQEINNKDTNANSKMSSLSYSNSRNLSYEATKTLATIGEGNLNIKDKDGSDDTTRLNRDTASINKELYDTSVSSNIDAGVDMRLFSE
ncbi:hypothetical protein CCAL13119_05185 [Campylobacter sp. RM13119]|uniref:hypothetical protein n=1 Tax=Campylobacter californiensis TaxID=1032243 RepID=UPI0014749C36|nr:hypothetical protein [Campylobacter sp. RM13119]MBE3606354.1 hypothetical protein [Campylobacter sp. RM13119]